MDIEYRPQDTPFELIRNIVVGFYAWVLTLSFGAVLIDIMYANLAPGAAAAFSEAADFLLLIAAVTVMAAIAAIGLSWPSRAARNTLIASLAIIIFGAFIPLLSAGLFPGLPGSRLSEVIRIAISGVPSILAFYGLVQLSRRSE